MTIKQLNASYIAHDDRLLFRFNTADNQEFRFWFTRRVTLFILAATNHLMVKNLEKKHSSSAAKAITEFGEDAAKTAHEKSQQEGGNQYLPADNYPLGADPILVLDVRCNLENQGAEDILSLDLILPAGANLNMKLAGETLHGMCMLLNQLREHAAWGDVPKIQESDAASEGEDVSKEGLKPSVH